MPEQKQTTTIWKTVRSTEEITNSYKIQLTASKNRQEQHQEAGEHAGRYWLLRRSPDPDEIRRQTKASQPVCHNFQPGRRHNHDYLQNDDRKTQKQNQKTTTEQLKNAGKSAARCEGDRRPVHECIAGRQACLTMLVCKAVNPTVSPTNWPLFKWTRKALFFGEHWILVPTKSLIIQC